LAAGLIFLEDELWVVAGRELLMLAHRFFAAADILARTAALIVLLPLAGLPGAEG
jgi:hypothetical protein